MGKKYFETKTGSLEDVSTKIAKEQPTITKPELNVRLERKTYFDNKPGSWLPEVSVYQEHQTLEPGVYVFVLQTGNRIKANKFTVVK